MKIVALYDFNHGKSVVETKYAEEYAELKSVISKIDATELKTKISQEINMEGKPLYSPKAINDQFRLGLNSLGWNNYRVNCDYRFGELLPDYSLKQPIAKPFRDMDFVKEGCKLGIEVQFGKYAFMVYNVCAKMTIFSNLGVIDTGIEIVPVRNLVDDMSSGVSYFEQFAWDLEQRGVSNIDIPVLILGVDM